jgi:hypothetical protein
MVLVNTIKKIILSKEFVCKYDCIKSVSISDKTLAKALDKNILYQGYFYKSLGSKIFIIA